jgi:hypothetical protein
VKKRSACGRLQRPHEGDDVALFLRGQLQSEGQIEELDGVIERRQPIVVNVWGW